MLIHYAIGRRATAQTPSLPPWRVQKRLHKGVAGPIRGLHTAIGFAQPILEIGGPVSVPARTTWVAFSFALVLGWLVLAPSAGAQTAPQNSVTLEWTAPGDDGLVGQASGYDLRFSTNAISGTDTLTWWNNASSATALPSPSPAGSTDQAQVTGLSYDTQYYFIIRARDEAWNWSGFSNVASHFVPACSAPTDTPGNFTVSENSGAVDLSWSGTTDPLAASLHIYRGTGAAGSLVLLTSLSPSQLSYTDGSVSPGATYRYAAAWAETCDGPTTATVSITLSGPPSPPPTATEKPAVHAYPNPSSGPVQFVITVTGSSPQPVLIRLFDSVGHWIADLASGTYTPGQHPISWDRTNRNRDRLSPGYYEALGTVGSEKVRERIVLLP